MLKLSHVYGRLATLESRSNRENICLLLFGCAWLRVQQRNSNELQSLFQLTLC